MRRIVTMVLAVALVVVGFVYERRREAGAEGGTPGRLDRGITVEGQKGIDPHGQAFVDKRTSPLRIDARLEVGSSTGARLAIEVASLQDLAGVDVTVERYDGTAVLGPDWSQEVWSGNLRPDAPHKFRVDVPYGAKPPVRLRVAARAAGDADQRFSASAIVRPVAPTGGGDPTPH